MTESEVAYPRRSRRDFRFQACVRKLGSERPGFDPFFNFGVTGSRHFQHRRMIPPPITSHNQLLPGTRYALAAL
jgi:hypothetical protein